MSETIEKVRRLTVTVTDEDGNVVYETWNADMGWKSALLVFDATQTDHDGNEIGLSLWDVELPERLEAFIARQRDGRS